MSSFEAEWAICEIYPIIEKEKRVTKIMAIQSIIYLRGLRGFHFLPYGFLVTGYTLALYDILCYSICYALCNVIFDSDDSFFLGFASGLGPPGPYHGGVYRHGTGEHIYSFNILVEYWYGLFGYYEILVILKYQGIDIYSKKLFRWIVFSENICGQIFRYN